MKKHLLTVTVVYVACTFVQAAVLFNTLGPAEWSFSYALGNGQVQSFGIPPTESWSVASITLMLGQGDNASGTLSIQNAAGTSTIATTEASSMTALFDFQPLTFTFASPVSLSAGTTYRVREDFNPADLPNTSLWDYNSGQGALMTRIEGTSNLVPEPQEYAIVAGLGLLGFALWRPKQR